MYYLSAIILVSYHLSAVVRTLHFLLILSSIAGDQSSSVSFLHLLYYLPREGLVAWNGRTGLMASQIPLSHWSLGLCPSVWF